MLPTPLPADELPRWLKQRSRNVYVIGGSAGRLRLLCTLGLCVLLGFLFTTLLGGPGHTRDTSRPLPHGSSKNPSSTLLDKNGAGTSTTTTEPAPPSIKGALKDLHHALSGSLSSLTTLRGSARNATQAASNSSVSEETILPGGDLLGARTRVGKVTIIFGGAATYERAVRTHEAHDRIHGYPLHVLRHGIMDDVWSKPAYILSLLLRELSKPESERLQWLLWVDADTILLNPYVPIETFLPPEPEFDDVHLLVTNDWNGLNNGVFPVRVTQWAADLFAAIVSFRHYRPDTPLQFRDQSAMDALLRDAKFARHTLLAPQRWFNAYQGEHNETLAPFQVRRGDFLVHFAGVGDRDARMAYWLERVDQHLPDWEIAVQHTSYPSEAREFWATQRRLRSEAVRAVDDAKAAARKLMQDTDEQLVEFRVRLLGPELEAISVQKGALRAVVDKSEAEAGAINTAAEELKKAAAPLATIAAGAQKEQLKKAHEALFAAEKALLNHAAGATNHPLQDATAALQEMIMQSTWNKGELGRAVELVREKTEVLVIEAAALAAAAAEAASPPQESKTADDAPAAVVPAEEPKLEAASSEGVVLTHTQVEVRLSTSVVVVMETRAAEVVNR